MEEKGKVKALHFEINAIRHQWKFTTLSNKYDGLETGFPVGQIMRLFTVKNKTKRDQSNKKLIKAVLRQKYFLEVIQSDTNLDILTLDINTGELDPLRMMISKWTPNQYSNLSLFLSEDKQLCSSQRYYFQYIIHMEEEATAIMHNLTPVLTFKYGDYGKT